MADRLRTMPTPGLERALESLGSEIDFPEPSSLAADVVERIHATPSRAASARDWGPTDRIRAMPDRRRTLLLVAATLLALAAIAAAIRLSVGTITIRQDRLPATPPTESESGPVLGRPVTLEEARAAVGFQIALPTRLGLPDEVALSTDPHFGERVVLVWRPGPGLPPIRGLDAGALLMEFFGEAESAAKLLAPDVASVEEIEVDGARGLWITGRHELDLGAPGGSRRLRVAGNVLLWTREGITFRLETRLRFDPALQLAESTAPPSG